MKHYNNYYNITCTMTLSYYATRFNCNSARHWQKIEVDGCIHECCSCYDEVIKLGTGKLDKPIGDELFSVSIQ